MQAPRSTTVDRLVIDDLGLRALAGDEPLDLYEVIRARHERASTIMTSNRAVHELAQLFADLLLASPAMDRLLHHAHVVVIDDESFRNPTSTQRRNGKNSTTQEVTR